MGARSLAWLCGALAWLAGATAAGAAEPIKVAFLEQTSSAPVYIAKDKGYFAAQGLDATLLAMQSGQAIAVAVVSGDVDFGVVGISGGFYSLAGKGELKIIGGAYSEAPGFPVFGLMVSNRAWAAGLKHYKDLTGRTVAVTAVGSAGHYTLALLCEKFGVDLKTIRIVPTQGVANSSSALSGGTVDASLQLASQSLPVLKSGGAKLIGWAGDEVPWQLAVTFAATKTANGRPQTVKEFLAAYRHGAETYHDAFIGPDGKRMDASDAPALLDIIARHVHEPPDQIAHSIGYVDREARVDVQDVLHQVAWYRAEGMVKGEFDPASVMDMRYVVPKP